MQTECSLSSTAQLSTISSAAPLQALGVETERHRNVCRALTS